MPSVPSLRVKFIYNLCINFILLRLASGRDHVRGQWRGLSNGSVVRSKPGGGTDGKVGARHPRWDGPTLEVPVEGTGILHHSDGRMAARSERQCVEGAGDGEKVTGRTTYQEHAAHVGHGARDPVTDGLVEVIGILQHSNGRMAARSERQCVEGAGDGEKVTGRNTYSEHAAHVGHGARGPVTDGLVEGTGILQHSDGRMAARSERQCVEGAGDGEKGIGEDHVRRTCNSYRSPSS